MDDMCKYLNVRPAWNNKKNDSLTDSETMGKCVEIANFIENELIPIRKSQSFPIIKDNNLY